MILLIDNYDSFSYNLFQLIGEIEPDIKIIRNDEMTIEEIKKLNPSRIILQYFHDLCARCSRRRYESRKAWQQSRILPVRNGRLSGSSWRKHSAKPRKMYRAFE